jgi:hypothetical protein
VESFGENVPRATMGTGVDGFPYFSFFAMRVDIFLLFALGISTISGDTRDVCLHIYGTFFPSFFCSHTRFLHYAAR